MATFRGADDILTLLIHLGYLTFDFDKKTARIPNHEVQQEFINSIEDGGWENVMGAIRRSEELLDATLAVGISYDRKTKKHRCRIETL